MYKSEDKSWLCQIITPAAEQMAVTGCKYIQDDN